MAASNTYFDPTKLAAAIAAQGAGADGRTVLTGQNLLNVLTNVNAPTYVPASQYLSVNGDDGASWATDPAYYQDSFGNRLDPVDGSQYGDPTGQYFQNSLENPSSTGGKDQAQVTYKINPDGSASPVAANNQYAPSAWSDWGRLATELGAVVGSAGLAGSALAGGGAAAGGAGGGATAAGSTGGGLLGGGGTTLPVSGGIAGASGTTGGLGSSIGAATADAGGLATAAPAYGGVGTAGAGAAGEGATVANPGFWSSLGAGDLGGAASSAAGSIGNYLSTPGGVQTAAGLLGAAAGAVGGANGLNSATTTTQNTVDPRVAQYVYGANGTSGLLGNVNSLMNSQLATGGLNANQTQGLNMQLAALNDPAYASSLQQQRATGSGLLAAPQAGNPFSNGGASLSPQANSQIQGSAMPPGFQPMATQLNPQRPPNMTGLLGNLRPTGQ